MKLFHSWSLSFFSALLCAVAFSGCNQDILNDHGRRPIGGISQTDSNNKGVVAVDFEQVNKTVLVPVCLKCHGASSGREDLSTYASVIETVVPGNADKSPLLRSLQGAGFGGTMPRRAGPLSQDKIDLIRNWINGGAIETAPTAEVGEGTPGDTAPSTEPSPVPSTEPSPIASPVPSPADSPSPGASPNPSPSRDPEPQPAPPPQPAPQPAPAPAPPEQVMKFDELKNIVLGPRCARCHTGDDAREGVKFDSYQDVFAVTGVVIPGDPDKSLLYQVVRDDEMPPTKRGQPSRALPASEKELIRKWIAHGAQN